MNKTPQCGNKKTKTLARLTREKTVDTHTHKKRHYKVKKVKSKQTSVSAEQVD